MHRSPSLEMPDLRREYCDRVGDYHDLGLPK